jgi:hypothetical protein
LTIYDLRLLLYECGVTSEAVASTQGEFGEGLGRGRAPSLESIAARVREALGAEWLPRVYAERVRTLRTRSFQLPPAKEGAPVRVQHTLLGVELKVGRRRLSCPDLSTARYLAVFARAGCSEVAVPYDITKISRLADDLESSWQRAMLLADHLTEGRDKGFRTRLRHSLAEEIRREIAETGPGSAVPRFRQDTKQGLYREPEASKRARGA